VLAGRRLVDPQVFRGSGSYEPFRVMMLPQSSSEVRAGRRVRLRPEKWGPDRQPTLVGAFDGRAREDIGGEGGRPASPVIGFQRALPRAAPDRLLVLGSGPGTRGQWGFEREKIL